MEAVEEAIPPQNIPSDDSAAAIVKGKRTKRHRLQMLPPALSTSSPMFCGSLTEEEEDMANCLILLAEGRGADSTSPTTEPAQIMKEAAGGATVKFTSRRFAEAATTTNGRAGFYVYECKTCNKCFPSFQALGGHRASHKKPKLESRGAGIDEDSIQLSMNSFPAPAAAAAGGSNGKPRVHECSICGCEFSSGQALGGHMRRHRPASFPEPQDAKKERSGLPLDLNLPATADEDNRSCCELQKPPSASSATAFSFTSKAPLIFSSSALVDCHY